MKRPTLSDVAELAGVSVSTASQAYSHKRPVSKSTRARILDAASVLGYQPKHNGIPTVGLLVRPTEAIEDFPKGTTSFSSITGAVTLACLHAGYSVIAERTADAIIQSAPDLIGCIVLHPEYGDPELERLNSRGVPVVAFDADTGKTKFDWWIGINYRNSVFNLLRHMHSSGASRIACIVGQTDNTYRRSILWAYSAFAAETGQTRLIRLVDTSSGRLGAAETAAELFNTTKSPDGILASSSVFAAGVLDASESTPGRQVPGSLKVATVFDGPLAEYARTPITGLRIDMTHLGEQLVSLLKDRLAGATPPEKRESLHMGLVARESTTSTTENTD